MSWACQTRLFDQQDYQFLRVILFQFRVWLGVLCLTPSTVGSKSRAPVSQTFLKVQSCSNVGDCGCATCASTPQSGVAKEKAKKKKFVWEAELIKDPPETCLGFFWWVRCWGSFQAKSATYFPIFTPCIFLHKKM